MTEQQQPTNLDDEIVRYLLIGALQTEDVKDKQELLWQIAEVFDLQPADVLS